MVRFAVVGVFNTATSYAIYAAMLWAGLTYPVASLVSIVAGIVVGFATQGVLVFGGASFPAFARFVLVWAVLYAVYVVVVGLAEWGWQLNNYIGGLLALVVTTVCSFFLQRRFVFRLRRDPDS